jgi:hypothetical protein
VGGATLAGDGADCNDGEDEGEPESVLAVVRSNQLQLTPKGSAIAQQIGQADCMRMEKMFLDELGSRASETRMKALLRLESLL